MLVVAGPGSGKTRVVTERIRRLLTLPSQHFRVLALTFTNKAANEMVERLEEIPEVRQRAFVGTMHSFCTEVLANRGKSVGIIGLPHIFESFQDRKQVLSDAVRGDPELLNELRAAGGPREQNQQLDRWVAAIGEAKNALLFPETIDDAVLRRVYEAYDAGLRACGVLDFDDLLLLTYRLFEERPEIAAFYRRQYRYVCVDEAQDLNEAQYRVLCALCGREYFNIVMVGDPKQAIFVWNGASPKYMDLFERDFGAKRLELNENFRSSQAVVAAARALDDGYSVEGQLPVPGMIRIEACADEEEEGEFVASTVGKLVTDGHRDIEGKIGLEKIAVLGRTKFALAAVERVLADHGLSFYKKVSAANYESESDVVEEFELALRVLSNPLDRLHLGRLVAKWKAGVGVEAVYGETDLRTLSGLEVLERLSKEVTGGFCGMTMNAVRAVRWTPDDFKFLKGVESLERDAEGLEEEERALVLGDLREWRKHWDYFVRSGPGGKHSVPSFLNQVALGTTQQPRQEGVALLTVHSAKGTEFDVVFVVGMSEGTFPDFRAKGESMREEQRNAFVAVTRSRRLLFLSYPKMKMMPWGDLRGQAPSRFLGTLRNVVASHGGGS